LKWHAYDPQTGELLRERDLVRLRGTWHARGCCEVAALDDGLVATLGGVTLAVDVAGTVRWIRTHVALPADEDPRWLLQMYQPPLVRGDRVYVAQPGVRTVDCLSAATGRRWWRAVLPEIIGIVGCSRDLLILRTETDLRALALTDGATRWRHPFDHLHSFQLVDDDSLLIARRHRPSNQNEVWQTQLAWLDPANGQMIASTILPTLADGDPHLGPLEPYQSRLFTFFGRGQHDPTRDVVELIPVGTADGAPVSYDAWQEAADRSKH